MAMEDWIHKEKNPMKIMRDLKDKQTVYLWEIAMGYRHSKLIIQNKRPKPYT